MGMTSECVMHMHTPDSDCVCDTAASIGKEGVQEEK